MRRLGAIAVLVAALGAPAAMLPGCFQELSVDPCGGFDDVEPACDACMERSCCEQARACRDSPACAALFDCLSPCGDDAACRARCADDHPSDEAAAALSTCRMEICEDRCTNCAGYFAVQSAACDDCVRTSCCDVATECFDDPTCNPSAYCTNECDHPGCNDLCSWLYPAIPLGVDFSTYCPLDQGLEPPVGRRFGGCLYGECAVACELGRRFHCLDAFQWPEPPAPEATHSTRRFVIGHCAPMAGATFRACGIGDGDCSDPVASTILDEDGKGMLTLDVSQGAFGGYLETFGVDGVPGELRFISAPLLVDRHRLIGHYTDEAIDEAHQILDVPRLEDRGLVLIYPGDCDGTAAPGIRFETDDGDAQTVGFYLDGEGLFPDLDLTETHPGNNRGGGYGNVPAGAFSVRAIEVATGRLVAQTQVLVRAGWTTVAILTPTP